MGKKTRPGTGRRTILQLSPPGPRSGSAGGREEAVGSGSEEEQEANADGQGITRGIQMKTPMAMSTQGLSLLGAYADSDEEDAADAPSPSAKGKHNQPADIDSTLANFMAEIDAITTQPAQSADDVAAEVGTSEPTPPRPEPRAEPQSQAHNGVAQEFQYNTQVSLAGVGVEMGDWQEVWDENTGCYYYWNTQTNEVAWELPHYLANQVQGLQQYADSSPVNGDGVSHQAGYYAEHGTAVVAGAVVSKRETKKKEVIESVVALTSEEEERKGVAASLLAPLIPPEVKEAEEKWRKRVLATEEKQDATLEAEGEAATSAGSPAKEPDPQGSKPQSRESSEAEEEETEEDTMELELALERKKAELRALEEGEGSAGGSSPCSEASQEGQRGAPVKKAKWKTAFLRATSPDSNSRGSEKTGWDTPDPADPAHSKTIEKQGEEDTEKAASRTQPKEEEETADLKFQIGELANTLTSKMEFLGIHKKAVSNFQLLLLQTETRIADWREGALNGSYLRRRLQEAGEHIKHYELNATPKGWSCHWDSDDGEIEEVEMEDEEGEPPAPGTEDKTGEPAASVGSLPKAQKRKAPGSGSLSKTVTIGSCPILYTQPSVTAAPVMASAGYWGLSAAAAALPTAETAAPPMAPPPSRPPPPAAPLPGAPDPAAGKTALLDKTKKQKKEKTKKSKTKMPSLVKKWQSIQKELDEEEKSSSSDEDRDQLNSRRIEEWKQQQLTSGKATKNANFEVLPHDWRERLLKKRKMMQSS